MPVCIHVAVLCFFTTQCTTVLIEKRFQYLFELFEAFSVIEIFITASSIKSFVTVSLMPN